MLCKSFVLLKLGSVITASNLTKSHPDVIARLQLKFISHLIELVFCGLRVLCQFYQAQIRLFNVLGDIVFLGKCFALFNHFLKQGLDLLVFKLILESQKLVHVEILFSIEYFFMVHELDEVEISARFYRFLDEQLVGGAALVKKEVSEELATVRLVGQFLQCYQSN